MKNKYSLESCCEKMFVHKFQTEQNKYIYDVNTMNIVRIDDIIWEIISDYGRDDSSQISLRYSDRYSSEQIESAYEKIAVAQKEKGLFLANRPQILMSFTEEYIQEKLDSERSILHLNVTEDCNFDCSYCIYSGEYINRHKRSNRVMDRSIAKKAIDDFLEASVTSEMRSIGFYGGEPLLNFTLIKQAVDYIRKKEKGVKVNFTITTNGFLLKGEAADFLTRHDFTINVSLDGPKQIHDRYRRTGNGSPTWETVTSNATAFLEKFPQYKTNSKFGITAVIAPPAELNELEHFFSLCELVTKDITASFVDSISTKQIFEGKITGTDEMYRKFLDNLETGKINSEPAAQKFVMQKTLFQENWLKFHKRFSRYDCSNRFPKKYCLLSTCIPGVRRTFVSVDGNYWPCERVSESDYLRIGSIYEGLNAAKIRQLLLDWVELNKSECSNCFCLHTCQIGCWSNSCDGQRPTEELKRKACEQHRRDTHNLLVDYCSVLEKNPHALDYMKDITLS